MGIFFRARPSPGCPAPGHSHHQPYMRAFTAMTGAGGVQLIEQAIANPIIIGWYRTVRDMLDSGSRDAAKNAIAYLDQESARLGSATDVPVADFRHAAKHLYVSLANIDALVEEAARLPGLTKGAPETALIPGRATLALTRSMQ